MYNKNHPNDFIDAFVDFRKSVVRKVANEIVDKAIELCIIDISERDEWVDEFMNNYRIDPFDRNCILLHTHADWVIHISELMYATDYEYKLGLVKKTKNGNKLFYTELRIYSWLSLCDA